MNAAKKLAFTLLLAFAAAVFGLNSGAEEDKGPRTTPPRESVKPVERPDATPTPIITGENLLANGDFEKKNPKHDRPAHWQLCDGLTTFYESFKGRGKVIRIDTSVEKQQARERWQVMIEKGVDAPPAPEKKEAEGKYGTIGAVDGVHFFSDPISVKKGARYKLAVDTKGLTTELFFTKIFVKGYTQITRKRKVSQEDGSIREETQTEQRQVYKWYLQCRNLEEYKWRHYEEWLPNKMPQNVDFVKICIYAYWPCKHMYYFDDLSFYEGVDPPEEEGEE
ncbi:MAG: hypothetical protein U5N86_11780 [Planctomycetota bacterium]|nr:hypothetical protein [Planctomycetota bacterium]